VGEHARALVVGPDVDPGRAPDTRWAEPGRRTASGLSQLFTGHPLGGAASKLAAASARFSHDGGAGHDEPLGFFRCRIRRNEEQLAPIRVEELTGTVEPAGPGRVPALRGASVWARSAP